MITLRDALEAELQAGLPRLAGGAVVAEIPLRQEVLEQVLPLLPGVPADLRVELGPQGHLLVRYGVFHANARLRPEAEMVPVPVVTLELASQLVAWGLQRAPLPPFVRVTGRQVRIHLADVPALRAARPLWRHVQQITFASAPRRLDVRVSLRIT